MRRLAGFFCIMMMIFSGCALTGSLPHARELENTAMLRVLGIDISPRELTGLAVTAVAEPIVEEEIPHIFKSSAKTLPAAVSLLQSQGSGEVSLAYVGQVIIGESAARRSVTETLQFAVDEGTIGLDATVWIVRGTTAAEAMINTTGIIDRLTALETGGGRADIPIARSVKETASTLAEYGCTLIPALSWSDETLLPAGYAVVRDGALLGYVDGAGARGVELLLGKTAGQVVEVETASCAIAALKVTSVRTRAAPVIEKGELTGLTLVCKIRAAVAQLQGTAQREELATLLEQEECGRIERTLEVAQGLRADYLNLMGDAVLSAPWKQKIMKEQWEKAFPALPVSVTVSVVLLDTLQNTS